MKAKYTKPIINITLGTSEGVYMSSGQSTNCNSIIYEWNSSKPYI